VKITTKFKQKNKKMREDILCQLFIFGHLPIFFTHGHCVVVVVVVVVVVASVNIQEEERGVEWNV
jgi:high-affinity nickel permease